MKRKAVIIDKSSHNTVIICLLVDSASEILPYVFNDSVSEEFDQIRELIRTNARNREKYCKCDVSRKAENMYEMRFTRNGRNDRVYCQEIRKSGCRYVVMCELFVGKKSQDIPKRYRERIETMGGYEFEII